MVGRLGPKAQENAKAEKEKEATKAMMEQLEKEKLAKSNARSKAAPKPAAVEPKVPTPPKGPPPAALLEQWMD